MAVQFKAMAKRKVSPDWQYYDVDEQDAKFLYVKIGRLEEAIKKQRNTTQLILSVI